MKKKLYWLASYPKSGNTWFRIFLSNYLTNGKADINNMSDLGTMASNKRLIKKLNPNYKRYFDAEEMNNLRPDTYRLYNDTLTKPVYNKIHDAYRILDNGKELIPSDISAGIIYFIRNPFDIAVSFSNHMGFSIDKSIEKMNDNKFKIGGVRKQLSQHLFTWSNHVLSWSEQKNIPVLILKYEDMLDDTFNQFKSSIKFLGLKYDENKLKTAIEMSSFDKLKKIEEKIGFKEKPKKSEKFFNKGISWYSMDILNSNQKFNIYIQHKEIINKFKYI